MKTYTEKASLSLKLIALQLHEAGKVDSFKGFDFLIDKLSKAKVIHLPIGGRLYPEEEVHLMENDPAILKLPEPIVALEYKLNNRADGFWIKNIDLVDLPFRIALAFDMTLLNDELKGIGVISLSSKNGKRWGAVPLICYIPGNGKEKNLGSLADDFDIPEKKKYQSTKLEIRFCCFMDELFNYIANELGKEKAMALCEADMLDEVTAVLDFLYDTNKLG